MKTPRCVLLEARIDLCCEAVWLCPVDRNLRREINYIEFNGKLSIWLEGKSLNVIYTVPTINRLIESGEPGVTSGILQDEDAECIVLETSNGMTEHLMKAAIIRIVPRK